MKSLLVEFFCLRSWIATPSHYIIIDITGLDGLSSIKVCNLKGIFVAFPSFRDRMKLCSAWLLYNLDRYLSSPNNPSQEVMLWMGNGWEEASSGSAKMLCGQSRHDFLSLSSCQVKAGGSFTFLIVVCLSTMARKWNKEVKWITKKYCAVTRFSSTLKYSFSLPLWLQLCSVLEWSWADVAIRHLSN